VAGADKDELPHVTTALESDYDMLQWHIARISHKSSCNAMPNKEAPMSSALLGLPRAPKALLLQHTGEGKLNMVGPR
jgi:hypothetical protein